MTTPNIENLIAKLIAHNLHYSEQEAAAMVVQSQAERIKDLESQQVPSWFTDQVQAIQVERDTLRAKLAALQVDDELPEPALHRGRFLPYEPRYFPTRRMAEKLGFTQDPKSYYTADQLRQAQATVRAKMVPLEKDAARYRWLRERYTAVDFDWEESGQQAVIFTADDFPIASASCDETIDAAMGITGEPK